MLTEGQELLRSVARDFACKQLEPRAAQIDETEEFSTENFHGLAELGFCGLTVPESLGGAGGGYADVAIVIEELAAECGSTSLVYLSHLSLGVTAIVKFGTEEQANRHVPPLAQGKQIAAFALTEPGTGSDALALETTAIDDGNHWILNGTKSFISNGDIANIFIVFARDRRPSGYRGISAFIVERETHGFLVNPMLGKMGLRGSPTSELIFDSCRIPKSNLLGPLGGGYQVALRLLTSSRVSVAAQCVGLARGAYDAALTYAQQRTAFGTVIAEKQAVAFMLADMATEIDAARLMTQRAANLVDAGEHPVRETAMAKLYASEAAVRVASNAVQIHGGAGYFKPSKVERIYRDVRATPIYEGSSEIQRLIISRSIIGTKRINTNNQAIKT